jgi:hypothetical protein
MSESSEPVVTCLICGSQRTNDFCLGCARRGFRVHCKPVGEAVVTVKKLSGEKKDE